MSKLATLLHISDLHLVDNIMEEGRSLYFKGPNTHSYAKLDSFTAAVHEITHLRKKPIDILLATGDITTHGSIASLNTAREFIEEENVYKFTPKRRVLGGLGMKPQTRILVPGNHDRYAGQYIPLPEQIGNQDFETVLGTPNEYPYVVGYRTTSEAVESDVEDSQDFAAVLFFVFDSTLVQPSRRDFYNKIARGRIETGECSRLRELAEQIKAKGEVLGLDGKPMKVDFSSSVRIAVLHHHPVLPNDLRDTTISRFARMKRKLDEKTTLLENSSAFIDACFSAEIDVVLFGHQHKEYEVVLSRDVRRESTTRLQAVRFFCCPSTSEYHEKYNGFNLIDIYPSKIAVEQYRWYSDGKRPRTFVLAGRTPYPLIRGDITARQSG